MNKTIKISLDDSSNVELSWSNSQNFLRHFSVQRLEPFKKIQSNYVTVIEEWANRWWNRYQHKFNLYSDLPKNAKVLDVGCGCALMDLIASKYNDTLNFYLLDKDEFYSNFVWFDDKHVFYHSWDVVNDFIINSNLDNNRISCINYDAEWPDDLDLVTSFFSWGFHYPIINEFNYWEKTLKHLKTGGRLYVDISNNNLQKYPDTIEFISDTLKSTPYIVPYDSLSITNNNYVLNENAMGYACLWKKNI